MTQDSEVSGQLYEFAERFAAGEIPAEDFTDAFMEKWKQERDSANGVTGSDEVSACLSSIFCLADLYNREAEREDRELDESRLRSEIGKTLGL
jgi:hypothetical protein